MDLIKFTKLMNLTASPIDGEALNAIRKANKMLEAENIDWNKFITGKIIKTVKTEEPPKQTYQDIPKQKSEPKTTTRGTYNRTYTKPHTKSNDSTMDTIFKSVARKIAKIIYS